MDETARAENGTPDAAGALDAFDALDTDAQVEVVRAVALEAAPAFGLDVASLDLVLHGFNTTFSLVTVDGRRVAVRVNTNSLSGPAQLAAQQAWMHAVATDTDVRVPDPLTTLDGAAHTSVRSDGVDREFLVVANTWLDGPDVGECDPEQARALGRAMATLHGHAASWSLPEGTDLPLFDEPLLGDDDLLAAVRVEDPAERRILADARERTRAAFDEVLDGAARIAIHGDLHGGNLKWHDGRLAVFDFDDSGIAVPALDLAVATFYLRRRGGEAVEAALRAGYADVADLPATSRRTHEALVASRQLLLANSLLTSSTPEFRTMAPEYLERTVERLRHWLVTGRFVLDPP